MRGFLFRLFLLVVGVAYLLLVARTYFSQRMLDEPTEQNLRRGLRWDPGNPLVWSAYARYQFFAGEPEKAADAFLRAATRNPLDQYNWDGLANASLLLGDTRKAEAGLRAALVAAPHSPYAAWRLANFLILQGRQKEALPYLRTAAASDPVFRAAAFDLGWKILEDPESILREVVPASLEARSDYMGFLLAKSKLGAAYQVWREIRKSRSKSALELGNQYIDALAGAGMGAEAARVWTEILQDTGHQSAKPPGELLTNADFEAELLNAGLDWRLVPGSGYQVEPDEFVLQHGSRSLRIRFDGTTNPDFADVWQLVPVEPNRQYRLRGYIKTENVGSDRGVQLCATSYAAPPEENFLLCGENRVGSNPWSLDEIHLQTGPHVRILRVGLRRFLSKKFNNLIQGKVWVDNLSLQEVPQ